MARSFPRFISKQVARMVSVKSALKIPTPVFLPFYHVVSDVDLRHILNYKYRNVEQFEKELDFYLRYFEPVELNYFLNPVRTVKKPFHITFDDGLRECAEIIAPILTKKGIPATFFINPHFIDNRELFHKYKASLIYRKIQPNENSAVKKLLEENGLWNDQILKADISQIDIIEQAAKMLDIDFHNFLKIHQPYLTTDQLKDLQLKGFTIGAHSNKHSEFWKLSEDEQKLEILSSMNWVISLLNPKIKTFAFPFTDSGVTRKVILGLQKEEICNISFGTAGIKYDELENHFQRYPVENSTDFIGELKTELVYFQFRKIIGKAIVKH